MSTTTGAGRDLLALTAARLSLAVGMVALSGCAWRSQVEVLCSSRPHTKPAWIRPSEDGARFLCSECGNRYVAWGFNYDHDASGRLLEDYWDEGWSTIEEDFREMEELGANVVRVHLQLASFMEGANRPDAEALKQLDRLVGLAETTGLHLNITGLTNPCWGWARKQTIGWVRHLAASTSCSSSRVTSPDTLKQTSQKPGSASSLRPSGSTTSVTWSRWGLSPGSIPSPAPGRSFTRRRQGIPWIVSVSTCTPRRGGCEGTDRHGGL